MLKSLCVLGTFLVLGTSPLNAQVPEAVLEKISVSGSGFDILVAVPKSPAATVHLSPEGAFIPLVGGELVLAFENWQDFVDAFDKLRWPVGALHFPGGTGGAAIPVAIYLVPADQRAVLSVK